VIANLSAQTLDAVPTLGGWINETANLLGDAGVEGALRDARILAAAGCGISPAQTLSEPDRPLTIEALGRLDELRRRRQQREPVSRILGRRSFMNLDLEISPATLDPRADTETLVEAVLQILREEGRENAPLDVLDLGTGTGAILIAVLQALPHARGLGVDISADALGVAERNFADHGVSARARLHRGSWFEGIESRFDVIVSNPPYIPTGDIAGLESEVVNYDPMLALDGGRDGLMAYRIIAANCQKHLRPDGWLLLEIGAGQEAAVTALLHPEGIHTRTGDVRVFPDLNGRSRCVAKMYQPEL
jgi:release factor glutamine methyltransferase